ncbi:MAG: hypothetical protein BWY85_00081 [Firmicutes bacterium ADurb.Bin506]|nr:MAG: hypothetical protein BWY85_00081 [Firmicutes bacterium ADurb.Bin506]
MRTLSASVIRVHGCEGFEADLDLGFGVHLRKHVRIRRRDSHYDFSGKGSEANHCLVVLIGGKDVILRDPREEARWISADVYVTYPTSMIALSALPEHPGQYVDVHEAMRWAASQGWEARHLREALRP